MKNLPIKLLLGTLILFVISCSDDNYDIYSEEELAEEPTEIFVDDALSFGLRNSSDLTNTAGIAYTNDEFYHVGSQDVDVVCENQGLSYSFDGLGDYFSFTFFGNDSGNAAAFGGFESIIDGEQVLLVDIIHPPHCPSEAPITVDYVEYDNRIRGTISGEFFRLNDTLITPFDTCVNYVSLGVLEASFDVELVVCN